MGVQLCSAPPYVLPPTARAESWTHSLSPLGSQGTLSESGLKDCLESLRRCRGRPGGALPGFVQAVLLMSAAEQAHIPEIRGSLETLLGNAAVLTALSSVDLVSHLLGTDYTKTRPHSNPSNNSACS